MPAHNDRERDTVMLRVPAVGVAG